MARGSPERAHGFSSGATAAGQVPPEVPLRPSSGSHEPRCMCTGVLRLSQRTERPKGETLLPPPYVSGPRRLRTLRRVCEVRVTGACLADHEGETREASVSHCGDHGLLDGVSVFRPGLKGPGAQRAVQGGRLRPCDSFSRAQGSPSQGFLPSPAVFRKTVKRCRVSGFGLCLLHTLLGSTAEQSHKAGAIEATVRKRGPAGAGTCRCSHAPEADGT